jgi:hypothetical protein
MPAPDAATPPSVASAAPAPAEPSVIPVTATQPADSDKSVAKPAVAADQKPRPKEIGGPKGPEPTRFGDWERDGRCVDF